MSNTRQRAEQVLTELRSEMKASQYYFPYQHLYHADYFSPMAMKLFCQFQEILEDLLAFIQKNNPYESLTVQYVVASHFKLVSSISLCNFALVKFRQLACQEDINLFTIRFARGCHDIIVVGDCKSKLQKGFLYPISWLKKLENCIVLDSSLNLITTPAKFLDDVNPSFINLDAMIELRFVLQKEQITRDERSIRKSADDLFTRLSEKKPKEFSTFHTKMKIIKAAIKSYSKCYKDMDKKSVATYEQNSPLVQFEKFKELTKNNERDRKIEVLIKNHQKLLNTLFTESLLAMGVRHSCGAKFEEEYARVYSEFQKSDHPGAESVLTALEHVQKKMLPDVNASFAKLEKAFKKKEPQKNEVEPKPEEVKVVLSPLELKFSAKYVEAETKVKELNALFKEVDSRQHRKIATHPQFKDNNFIKKYTKSLQVIKLNFDKSKSDKALKEIDGVLKKVEADKVYLTKLLPPPAVATPKQEKTAPKPVKSVEQESRASKKKKKKKKKAETEKEIQEVSPPKTEEVISVATVEEPAKEEKEIISESKSTEVPLKEEQIVSPSTAMTTVEEPIKEEQQMSSESKSEEPEETKMISRSLYAEYDTDSPAYNPYLEEPSRTPDEIFMENVKAARYMIDETIKNNPIFQDAYNLFPRTDAAKAAGSDFLKTFWEDKNNIEATIQFQEILNSAAIAISKKTNERPSKTPGCISFTMAIATNRPNLCLVSMSGKMNTNMSPLLERHANLRNQQQSNAYFVVISNKSIQREDKLLTGVGQDLEYVSPCSEKFLLGGVMFAEDYSLQNSLEFTVTGSVNYLFHPFYLPETVQAKFAFDQLLSKYSSDRSDVVINPKNAFDCMVLRNDSGQKMYAVSLQCCRYCINNLVFYHALMISASSGLIPPGFYAKTPHSYRKLSEVLSDQKPTYDAQPRFFPSGKSSQRSLKYKDPVYRPKRVTLNGEDNG